MPPTIRVSLERLHADRADAAARLDDIAKRKASLEAEEAEIRADLHEYQKLLQFLSRYVVEENDASLAAASGATPLAGLTGSDAAREYVSMRRGATVKFSDAFVEMQALGFDGTENAINVALAAMVRDLEIERVSRGIYRFPLDGEAHAERVASAKEVVHRRWANAGKVAAAAGLTGAALAAGPAATAGLLTPAHYSLVDAARLSLRAGKDNADNPDEDSA